MAIHVLVLAMEGPDGRKPGTIVNIVETEEDESFQWGDGEGPPMFAALRIPHKRLRDLPAAMKEFGQHTSRQRIQLERLPGEVSAQLRRKREHTVNWNVLKGRREDRGREWNPDAQWRRNGRKFPRHS